MFISHLEPKGTRCLVVFKNKPSTENVKRSLQSFFDMKFGGLLHVENIECKSIYRFIFNDTELYSVILKDKMLRTRLSADFNLDSPFVYYLNELISRFMCNRYSTKFCNDYPDHVMDSFIEFIKYLNGHKMVFNSRFYQMLEELAKIPDPLLWCVEDKQKINELMTEYIIIS